MSLKFSHPISASFLSVLSEKADYSSRFCQKRSLDASPRLLGVVFEGDF